MSPRRSSSSASASAVQAGPSTSKSPPASPSLARVPSTYPAETYDPRTPRRRSVALERVDESPLGPIAERNLATSPRSMTSDSEDDTTRQGREERIDSVDQDHEQEAPLPPHLVPPASVHDTYLARYIEPVIPTSSSRPQAPRSTSVPAIAQAKPSPGLLPAADLQSADASDPSRKGSEGKPIFEIFNAEPGRGSEGLVKALKGHLADVLRVQEDIGRMHLGLEGLDAEGDSLIKRERGVEELMERLGTLSETLRTYHELGTPRLHFPSDHRDTQGGEHEDVADADPSTALPNQPPHMTRLHSAHPDLGAPSTLQTSHTSPPAGAAHKPSPLQHKGVQDLKREEAGGHGGQGQGQGQERKGSVNSNLSPLRLSTDDYTTTPTSASAHPLRKKPSASFWDLEALKREREQREDQWSDHTHAHTHDNSHRGGGASIKTSPKRSTSQRRRYDSPIEMVDRSRPW